MAPPVDVLSLSSTEVGRFGEGLCASLLVRRGMSIVARNWRCPAGEVDVVADDCGTHVLVEVKTRVCAHGPACALEPLVPELAVDDEKLGRYRRLALSYLGMNEGVEAVRFDVAGVVLRPDNVASVHYIEGVWLGDE